MNLHETANIFYTLQKKYSFLWKISLSLKFEFVSSTCPLEKCFVIFTSLVSFSFDSRIFLCSLNDVRTANTRKAIRILKFIAQTYETYFSTVSN